MFLFLVITFLEAKFENGNEVDYRTHKKYWQNMNIFLNLLLLGCVPFPLLVPIFAVVENVDVYFAPYNNYIVPAFCSNVVENTYFSCHLVDSISRITRFIVLLISFAEGARTQILVATTFFSWLEMQSRYLFLINKQTSSPAFYMHYCKFRLALGIIAKVVSNWIRAMMIVCFFVIVVANVATIKLFSVLPLTVLWFVPACSILYSSALFFLFTHLTECYEMTAKILQKCRGEPRLNTKVNLRRLKGMPPVALRCGTAFILKRDTKTTYYDAVIQRTVDGILM